MTALGLRIEDVLLASWNLVGIPLVVAGSLAPVLALGDAPDPLAGSIQLVAVIAAFVAVATRPTGSVPSPEPLGTDARIAFYGPLVAAVAFVSGSVAAYLGIAVDGLIVGTSFLVITGAMVFADRLPVIDAGLRRILILPFILVCAGIFNGFAAELLEGLDVGQLITALTVDETGFGLIIGMLLAGLAVFYASLIVAPRMLVSPEEGGGCLLWPLRFMLYIVSAVLGIGWLAVLAG